MISEVLTHSPAVNRGASGEMNLTSKVLRSLKSDGLLDLGLRKVVHPQHCRSNVVGKMLKPCCRQRKVNQSYDVKDCTWQHASIALVFCKGPGLPCFDVESTPIPVHCDVLQCGALNKFAALVYT